MVIAFREDDWDSSAADQSPKEYDGPAGMDVDGIIESTWNEVMFYL